MDEGNWLEARLIPTSGISGAEEQERRATSALLAVMTAVREFGRGLTQPLGAPAGSLSAYIEVPFSVGKGKVYPDGLVRVQRGKRTWTALVEVKTSTNTLAADQLETYLDIARDHGFDALMTVSNEIPPVAGQHPTAVDKKKTKKVALHHLSWSKVLTEAVMQKEHRGVADPDQAWILGELIRYLEHPRSGALEFTNMGASWVPVREAVSAGTLRTTDQGAAEVVSRFDALLRYAGLRLGRQLGTDVIPALTRAEVADPSRRAQSLLGSLTSEGVLEGGICIPNTVGPMHVRVDMRAGQVTCHVDLDAPREGRPTTRVNWLLKQLRHAPDTLRLESTAAYQRGSGAAELLSDVREDPARLVVDPKKELRAFRVVMTTPMGSKRGRGRGGFIDSVLTVVDTFYADVLQHLKVWAASPPRMREPVEIPPASPRSLTATAQSSQDGPEPAPQGSDKDRTGERESTSRSD
ncbi:hypothetical protein BH24DEI2_BH24DEI2_25430 [soil metagenome]